MLQTSGLFKYSECLSVSEQIVQCLITFSDCAHDLSKSVYTRPCLRCISGLEELGRRLEPYCPSAGRLCLAIAGACGEKEDICSSDVLRSVSMSAALVIDLAVQTCKDFRCQM